MFLSEYGTEDFVYVPIRTAGSPDFATSSDWTIASGDFKISKDGGAFANLNTLPSFVAGECIKITLSATEMQCKRALVVAIDSATKAVDDMAITIDTYGNASAQHPAFPVDIEQINGSSTAAATLGVLYAAFPTGTVSSGATSTVIPTSLSDANDDWISQVVVITSGDEIGQCRKITDYSATGGTITVSPAFPAAPAENVTFVIIGRIE